MWLNNYSVYLNQSQVNSLYAILNANADSTQFWFAFSNYYINQPLKCYITNNGSITNMSFYNCSCSLCSSPSFYVRQSSGCQSYCSFVNSSTSAFLGVSTCEIAGNATFCPFFKYLNSTAFTCVSVCSGTTPLLAN